MSGLIDGILHGWKKNCDYGTKLIADLNNEQMISQPAPKGEAPTNHPAWVFSHLNAYLPVIKALILNEPFEDPKEHRFGMLSQPESNLNLYDSKTVLIDRYIEGHMEILSILVNADSSIFQAPVPLKRWSESMPTVGVALPFLMLNHENMHLGQVSAWRRIQGMPRV